ncbi:DUF1842 domain-containing protein [Oceanobacter mangrovi]|uniref:DUF1842 domain-containing protein n=1 Tax=Oceanobacter mangrovi TaxID=2862510 RepID=UPI001C8EBD6D|nr:DUF1842 domain-containing protein [Oceanobacter mangrovi]
MGTRDMQTAGVFLARYRIGNQRPGSKAFELNVLVGTAAKTIAGQGRVSQDGDSAVNIQSMIAGEYQYQYGIKTCHIMLELKGNHPFPGVPPVGLDMQNISASILLNEGWKTGIASYRYKEKDGNWVDVESQPVQLLEVKQDARFQQQAAG